MLINLAHFYGWKDEASVLSEIISFKGTLATASILFFSIISSLRVHPWGWLSGLRAWQWAAYLSTSRVLSGLVIPPSSCGSLMVVTSFVYQYGR